MCLTPNLPDLTLVASSRIASDPVHISVALQHDVLVLFPGLIESPELQLIIRHVLVPPQR